MAYLKTLLFAILFFIAVLIGKLIAKREVTKAPTSTEQLLGKFKVTSYRSVKEQTDNSPFWSSIGIHTNPWMVATSQDFLRDNRLHYNDLIYIEDVGFKFVGDCMARRYTNRFDVWVETLDQEKAFHSQFKKRKLKVWLIKKGAEL